MKDKELQAEIEQLKIQISELQKSREDVTSRTEVKANNAAVTDNQAEQQLDNNDTMINDIVEKEDLVSQVQELINALDEDINNTKPATLLVIFALGVLVGRLLPR